MSCSVSTADDPGSWFWNSGTYPAASMQVAAVLAQHRGSDEGDALIRDVEAIAVFFGVVARDEAGRNAAALVQDHAPQFRAAADHHLREDHGFGNVAVAVH